MSAVTASARSSSFVIFCVWVFGSSALDCREPRDGEQRQPLLEERAHLAEIDGSAFGAARRRPRPPPRPARTARRRQPPPARRGRPSRPVPPRRRRRSRRTCGSRPCCAPRRTATRRSHGGTGHRCGTTGCARPALSPPACASSRAAPRTGAAAGSAARRSRRRRPGSRCRRRCGFPSRQAPSRTSQAAVRRRACRSGCSCRWSRRAG